MSVATSDEKTTKGEDEQQAFSWADSFQWPPALILVIAAILKSHQLATSPYTANLIFESRLLTTALIAFELALAFWLVSRFLPGTARTIGLVVFTVFCGFGVDKVLSGAASCGCFGGFEIPPIVTLFVDIGMIALLLFWPAKFAVERLPMIWIAMGLMALVAALVPILTFTTSSLSDVGHVIGNGDMIVVDTSAWVGKQLPIARFIDGEPNFMKGDWSIILYHEDCPVCQQVIREVITAEPVTPTVFVEVPPYKSPTRVDQEHLLWRKLSDVHEWFVTAPDSLEIADGVVTYSHGQMKSPH